MLDSLKAFLLDFAQAETADHEFADNDYRLAAAALLIHIMAIDGSVDEVERVTLRNLIKQHYALDDAETDRLIEAAKHADAEAVDLYRFTSVLLRLDEAKRLRVVEMMWQIVYADGHRSEFEDNIVWRAADLLGISAHERIALRRRVAGQNTVES